MAKKKTVAKAKSKKRTRKAALSTAMGIKVFKGDKRLSQRTLKMFDPNTFIQGIVDDTRGHIYKAAGFIVDEVESVIDSLDVVVEEAIDSALENPAGTFSINMKKNQQSLNKITKKSEAILTDTTFMKKLMTKKFKEWDLKFDQIGSGGGGFGFGIPDIPDKDGRKKNNKGGRKPPKSGGPRSRPRIGARGLRGLSSILGTVAEYVGPTLMRAAIPVAIGAGVRELDKNPNVAGGSTIGDWLSRNIPGVAALKDSVYNITGGRTGVSKNDPRGQGSTIDFPVLDDPLKDASSSLLQRYSLRKGRVSTSFFTPGAVQQYDKLPGFNAAAFYKALASGVFSKRGAPAPKQSKIMQFMMENEKPSMNISNGSALGNQGLNRDNTLVPLGGTSPYSMSGGTSPIYQRTPPSNNIGTGGGSRNYSTDQQVTPRTGGTGSVQESSEATGNANRVVNWAAVAKKGGGGALWPGGQVGEIPGAKLDSPIEGNEKQQAIIREARRLGISPKDLATVISYETGGKFDPNIKGGTGGNYQGLIQFGPNERKKYGVREGQSFSEQMKSAGDYLEDRGLKKWLAANPDASLHEKRTALYSTINAGSPGRKHWGKTDGQFGTVQDKANTMFSRNSGHMKNANRFMEGASETSGGTATMSAGIQVPMIDANSVPGKLASSVDNAKFDRGYYQNQLAKHWSKEKAKQYPEGLDNLSDETTKRLGAMLRDAPEYVKKEIAINSAARSTERQAQLYAASGGNGMVARPGRSKHEKGNAVDLGRAGAKSMGDGWSKLSPETKDWMVANADKYGLYRPLQPGLSNIREDWHFEPKGSRSKDGIKPWVDPMATAAAQQAQAQAIIDQPKRKRDIISASREGISRDPATVQAYKPPKALSASMWGAQQNINEVKSTDYLKRDKIVQAQDQAKSDPVLGIGKDLLFPEKKATVNRQLNSLIRKDQNADRKASEATLSGSVVERAYNDVMKMVSNTMKDIMPTADKVVPPAKRAEDAQKEIDEQTSNTGAKGDAEKPVQSTKNDQPVKSRQADPKTAAAKPDQVPAHPKPPVAYAAGTNPKRDEIEATPTIENNPSVGGGGGW